MQPTHSSQVPFEIEFSKDFIEGKVPLKPETEDEEEVCGVTPCEFGVCSSAVDIC